MFAGKTACDPFLPPSWRFGIAHGRPYTWEWPQRSLSCTFRFLSFCGWFPRWECPSVHWPWPAPATAVGGLGQKSHGRRSSNSSFETSCFSLVPEVSNGLVFPGFLWRYTFYSYFLVQFAQCLTGQSITIFCFKKKHHPSSFRGLRVDGSFCSLFHAAASHL